MKRHVPAKLTPGRKRNVRNLLTELNSRTEGFVNIALSRGDMQSPMDGDDLQFEGKQFLKCQRL